MGMKKVVQTPGRNLLCKPILPEDTYYLVPHQNVT